MHPNNALLKGYLLFRMQSSRSKSADKSDGIRNNCRCLPGVGQFTIAGEQAPRTLSIRPAKLDRSMRTTLSTGVDADIPKRLIPRAIGYAENTRESALLMHVGCTSKKRPTCRARKKLGPKVKGQNFLLLLLIIKKKGNAVF